MIIWFRNDLRIHDNEALTDALNSSKEVYPVYVFDTRTFEGQTKYGFPKTGSIRSRFIHECVDNLKSSLQSLGSDLIIRKGLPEVEIYHLARDLNTSWVFCNRERTQEEIEVQDALERRLWSVGQELRYSRGKMLYYTADLPFPVNHTPDSFLQFRKEVDRIIAIREPLPPPSMLPAFNAEIDGETLSNYDVSNRLKLQKCLNEVSKGGEKHGLELLEKVCDDSIKSVKKLTAVSPTSSFSPYLSQGCLSPKTIYFKIKSIVERTGIGNDFFDDMYRHLLWRDFHRLMGKKHGNNIFKKGGLANSVRGDLSDDMSKFRLWSDALTGFPIVDAGITELKSTGNISRHVRRAVASFLVDELKVNWQVGAEYFESHLIDYDPCSNYGNWNYIAGLTNDNTELRYINPIRRSARLDPDGSYISKWFPTISKIPEEFRHQPFELSEEQQKKYNFVLGRDYPKACIRL